MAWLLGWIQHQQIASLGVARCQTAITTRFLTAQLDWPASKFNRKQPTEYPGITMYIYIFFFLDFNCQTVLKPIYIIQIIIYHDLSSLKFIYTHLHLRFHTASAGASTPTASFTRLERASSLEKQQPTKNKPLSDWNTQLKQHYVRKNGSCLWGVNYMGLVSIPYGDETQLDFTISTYST